MWLGLRENEVRALRDIREFDRNLEFAISEIYIGRYFSNFILSLNGSGRVRSGFGLGFFPKSRPDPNPLWVFCFKHIPGLIFNWIG